MTGGCRRFTVWCFGRSFSFFFVEIVVVVVLVVVVGKCACLFGFAILYPAVEKLRVV